MTYLGARSPRLGVFVHPDHFHQLVALLEAHKVAHTAYPYVDFKVVVELVGPRTAEIVRDVVASVEAMGWAPEDGAILTESGHRLLADALEGRL